VITSGAVNSSDAALRIEGCQIAVAIAKQAFEKYCSYAEVVGTYAESIINTKDPKISCVFRNHIGNNSGLPY
jgi:hypothetical protein